MPVHKENTFTREQAALQPKWRFIPLDQFSGPAGPSRESLSNRLQGLMEHLRIKPISSDPSLERVTLTAVPPYLMERVAPRPDWCLLLDGLDQALGEWVAKLTPKVPIRIVVGPPFSGIPEVLSHWAKLHKWRLVEGPFDQQILDGPKEWVEQFKHNRDMPLVIPRFEKLFLRHHSGLMLARQMLSWLLQRHQPCLIGIDSWAYAYLSKVLQLEALKVQPITLTACTSDHLSQWFRWMAFGTERIGIMFRQCDTGKFVLPPAGSPVISKNGNGVAPFLKHLSVYSRGNPGVAWRIWRHSLQYDIDEGVDEKAQSLAVGDRGRTMWVKTWSQVELPKPPIIPMDLFVLHSLLIHGGLSYGALTKTLAMLDISEIMESIHRLSGAGLVEEKDKSWQVTPLGYPSVREAMAMNGFQVDAF